MAYRTLTDWQQVVVGKTTFELARFVTSDLIGYRSTSVHRADDETSLDQLFQTLIEMGRQEKMDEIAS